jgi:hypothetical protein
MRNLFCSIDLGGHYQQQAKAARTGFGEDGSCPSFAELLAMLLAKLLAALLVQACSACKQTTFKCSASAAYVLRVCCLPLCFAYKKNNH